MANAIFIIHPRKEKGAWIFDDEAREIFSEPFVSGIPEMIDYFTKGIKNAKKGFTLLFSSKPIPDAQAHLVRTKIEGKGTWYLLNGTNMEGWLCPVLYEYFKTPPKNIYCKFEAMKK